LQPAPEILAANQKVVNEAQHQSNPKSTPFPAFNTFDVENALMDQQEPNMTSIELQHQKQNQQQNHVQHQQEYQQQQEWQQHRQQFFPNQIFQLPMQMSSQEQQQHQQQQQQQPILPNTMYQLPILKYSQEQLQQQQHPMSSVFGSEKGLTPGLLRRIGESETK
jgi:hypothetical protein